MSKAKFIAMPDQDATIAEIDISVPPSRVFEALTDPIQLMRWFTDASCPVKSWQMDARLGGKYSYATEKGNFVVNGVSEFKCHGEIIEIRSDAAAGLYLLVYTWIGNWHLRPGEENSCALGTHAHVIRHPRESNARRSRPGAGGSRRLQWRLARRGREA